MSLAPTFIIEPYFFVSVKTNGVVCCDDRAREPGGLSQVWQGQELSRGQKGEDPYVRFRPDGTMGKAKLAFYTKNKMRNFKNIDKSIFCGIL